MHGCQVWTEEGELFSFGSGNNGRLGHSGSRRERVPRKVDALAGHRVVGAVAGWYHTVVWTDKGEVFTFGAGGNGRLGHGTEECEKLPKQIVHLRGKKVVGGDAGACHTILWTEANEVFTFGHAAWGQLGHGKGEDEFLPRLVPGIPDAR